MKKILLTVAVLAIVLGMSNCKEEEETPNPFVGTWENDNHNLMVFTQNYVTNYRPSREIGYKGAYSYNDTHITITTDYRESAFQDFDIYPNPLVWSYKFLDNDNFIFTSSVTVLFSKVTSD